MPNVAQEPTRNGELTTGFRTMEVVDFSEKKKKGGEWR